MKTTHFEIIRLNIFRYAIRCTLTQLIVFEGTKRKCESQIYIQEDKLNKYLEENKIYIETLEETLTRIDKKEERQINSNTIEKVEIEKPIKPEIKSGDNVCYYHGYYTYGSCLDEHGDREVIDVHEYMYGKVLIVVGKKALCVFYNYTDNEHARLNRVFVNELHIDWFPINKLSITEDSEKEYLFERPELPF